MLSRVADSIYWMARHIERAENTARYVDVNLRLVLDQPNADESSWKPLIAIMGDQERFEENFENYNQRNVMQYLTFDPDNPNSILRSLHAARDNARSIREVINTEMWERLNSFHIKVREAAFVSDRVLASPFGFYRDVRESSHAFNGIMDATLSHDEAWHFGYMGRLLERADATTRILDVKYFTLLPNVAAVGTPLDDIQWASLLRSTSALHMYRNRHGRIDPEQVVEFLVLDVDFPRAVRFCVEGADKSLHAISGTPPGVFRNLAEQEMSKVLAGLDWRSGSAIVGGGLHEFLDDLQSRINSVGDAIFETFMGKTTNTNTSQEQSI